MKLRKIALAALSATLILGLTACGTSQNTTTGTTASTQKLTLRLADIQAADYPTVIGDNEFAKLIKERTKGRIEVSVYSNAQLGDEKTAIEQLQLGAIDFGRINASPLASFDSYS